MGTVFLEKRLRAREVIKLNLTNIIDELSMTSNHPSLYLYNEGLSAVLVSKE